MGVCYSKSMFFIFVLRWFFRFLWSSLTLFFGVVASYFIVNQANLSLPLGKLWFDSDVYSLNLSQVIVQRYLYHPLWDEVVVPILQYQSYIVLGMAFVGSLLLAIIAWRL